MVRGDENIPPKQRRGGPGVCVLLVERTSEKVGHRLGKASKLRRNKKHIVDNVWVGIYSQGCSFCNAAMGMMSLVIARAKIIEATMLLVD